MEGQVGYDEQLFKNLQLTSTIPWGLVPHLWHNSGCLDDVARGEAATEGIPLVLDVRVHHWHQLDDVVVPHVVDHLGEVERGDVCLQGPGGVGVAEHEAKVRHLVQHDGIVDLVLVRLVLFPVNEGLDCAEGEILLQGQSSCSDDEVRLKR